MPVGWPLHLDGAVKQRCVSPHDHTAGTSKQTPATPGRSESGEKTQKQGETNGEARTKVRKDT